MKKTFEIKIGNELAINKFGTFLFVVGILLSIITFGVLAIGIILPLEIKIIYYLEVISENWYLASIISLALIVIGIKLGELRNYTSTNLILEKDKVSFTKKGELIELPKWSIRRISKKNSRMSENEKIRIKTVTSKVYNLKSSQNIYNELAEYFPHKAKVNKKTLGNTV